MGVAGLFLVIGMIVYMLEPNTDTAGNQVERATPTEDTLVRAADVPALPFADNPDPTQCGIPTAWG